MTALIAYEVRGGAVISLLELEHFFLFRDRVSLPLAGQGLVHVRGDNRVSGAADQNGVGKTSIPHGLCYALFGEDLDGRRADAVACRFTTETCRAHVALEDGLGPWTVTRTRRPAGLSVTGIPGVGENEDAAEIQKKIVQRLGFGLRTFKNAVVFGQGSVDRYSLADQDEQMRMLDEIQGIDFRGALQRAQEWRSDLKGKLDAASVAAERLGDRILGAQREIEDARRARLGFEGQRQERLRVLADQADALRRRRVDATAAATASRDAFARAVRARVSDLQRTGDVLRRRLDDTRLVAAGDRRRFEDERQRRLVTLRKQERDVLDAVTVLDVETVTAERAKVEAEGLRIAIDGLAPLADVVADRVSLVQRANVEEAVADAAYRDLDARLSALLVQGTCPSCRRPAKTQRAAIRALFSADLKRLHADTAVAHVCRDDAAAAVRIAQAGYDRASAAIVATLPPAAQERGATEYAAELEALGAASSQRTQRRRQHVEALIRLTAAIAVDLSLEGLWPGQAALDAAENAVAKDLDAAARDAVAEAARVWDGQAALDAAEVQLSVDVTAHVAALSRTEKVAAMVDVAEYWVDAFGDRGIRSMLVDGVAEYVNARLVEHLERLTCGEASVRMSAQTEQKSGKLRERISFTTVWAWGASGKDGGSKGQDRRRDLAIFAAVQDLAESRSARPFPLKVYDEIFDALDGRGKELAMVWAREQAAAHGTALLITHSDEVVSSAAVDQTWTVVLDRGGARVEMGG